MRKLYKKYANMVFSAVILGCLCGCVYSTAALAPSDSAKVEKPQIMKNPSDILLTEGGMSERPYKVIGRISAIARSTTLLSSDPTRADVNEALRAEASKAGADAVIDVKYRTEPSGFASRGKMVGEGLAVTFN